MLGSSSMKWVGAKKVCGMPDAAIIACPCIRIRLGTMLRLMPGSAGG